MRKEGAILKAILFGQASIEFIRKTPVTRTPGEVTELTHN